MDFEMILGVPFFCSNSHSIILCTPKYLSTFVYPPRIAIFYLLACYVLPTKRMYGFTSQHVYLAFRLASCRLLMQASAFWRLFLSGFLLELSDIGHKHWHPIKIASTFTDQEWPSNFRLISELLFFISYCLQPNQNENCWKK